MKISNGRKMWSQPTVTSVETDERCREHNTHTGLSKDGTVIEYLYQGPGS